MRNKIIFGLFAALLAWWGWPMIDPHGEQDRCTLGSVSNEQYLTMLSEAKQQRANKWQKIRVKGPYADGGPREELITKDLMRRIKALSDRYQSIDGKIAAMHAVLRADGAIYTSSGKYAPHVKSSSNYSYIVPAWKWATYDMKSILRAIDNILSRWTIVQIQLKRDYKLEKERLDYIALIPVGPFAAKVGYDGRNCPEIF